MRAFFLASLLAAASALVAPRLPEGEINWAEVEARADEHAAELVERQVGKTPQCQWGVQQVALAGDGVNGGYGLLSTTVEAINSAIWFSNNVSIPYPRSDNNTHNAQAGVIHLKAYLKKYTAACPDTRIVLLGYSFGGIIVMNTLCGRSVAGSLPYGKPLTTQYQDRIVATIIFGDETYVPNQPYDVGNCTSGQGVLPRQNPAGCSAYAPTIQSWCDDGDALCCSGTPPKNIHALYPSMYNDAAASYARQQYLNSIFG